MQIDREISFSKSRFLDFTELTTEDKTFCLSNGNCVLIHSFVVMKIGNDVG